jgi:beta-galactosidase beta subunit
MHYEQIAKHRCMHYLSMKENRNQLHYLIHSFGFPEDENYNEDKDSNYLKGFKRKKIILHPIYFWIFY